MRQFLIRACLASALVAAFAATSTLLTGCQTTKPWQREILAHPTMAPDLDPGREVLRRHVLGVREGAVGGFGGGGGGCGCN